MPKEVDEFFRSIVRDVLADREKKNTTRNDYIQNLIYLKKKAEETGGSYTEEDITGHAVTFMTDGFETSSITMGFTMHHLSQNPHIQEALWKEVTKAREENQGQLPFEVLMELPLLDQVIHETLRLHPPLMAMEKVCTAPTTLRASDGTEVHAPRGLLCVVPLLGLHKDPRYFRDPERFDPDRFSPGRKSDIHKYAVCPAADQTRPRVHSGELRDQDDAQDAESDRARPHVLPGVREGWVVGAVRRKEICTLKNDTKTFVKEKRTCFAW
ncbi:Cytochrome P450 9e2 [Gryllus bimaculatus]|nr:Cytochrome P450 9e2 [Gryllus bimaculatus]